MIISSRSKPLYPYVIYEESEAQRPAITDQVSLSFFLPGHESAGPWTGVDQSLTTQSVVQGPAAVLSKNLLETKKLRSHPKPTESESVF